MALSVGLVTLNAKFIHSSLSIRYLRNAARRAGFADTWIQEHVIQQPVWKTAAQILKHKPDVLGISVYIWNRAQSFELIERLKKQNPELKIAVGGPEVSFETEFPDGYTVLAGEGETKWVDYLKHVQRGETPSAETRTRWNTYGTDLPQLDPPYIEEDWPQLKNRIAYLETSRGCPYLCSFCLSALDKKVRYFDDEAMHGQIERLVQSGVRRIKFVDRTFNLNPRRMKTLMRRLERHEGASFHFEIVGDILTPDLLDFLETVRPGMFQFEIGIQTTDPETQSTIERRQNNEKLFAAIERLVRQNRIHFHCDLIFGLPGETPERMLKSFEEVVRLRPHELQLGFLKFLPGAPIRDKIESHRYEFQSTPPYEMISNRDCTAGQLLYLKHFAEVFDLFYNSKRFRFSLDRLLAAQAPARVFHRLFEYMENQDLLLRPHSLDSQYRIFYDAFELADDPLGSDLLKLDYLFAQRVHHLPGFLKNHAARPANPPGKTWDGDNATPCVVFHHEIEIAGSTARMTASDAPCYYAIVHPKDTSGYIAEPALHKVAH